MKKAKRTTKNQNNDNINEETEKMLKEEMDRRSRNTTEEYRYEHTEGKLYRNILKMLMGYGSDYMSVDGLFNGENYYCNLIILREVIMNFLNTFLIMYIPKSIILISEYPIFETIEQIIRHIYIQ